MCMRDYQHPAAYRMGVVVCSRMSTAMRRHHRAGNDGRQSTLGQLAVANLAAAGHADAAGLAHAAGREVVLQEELA